MNSREPRSSPDPLIASSGRDDRAELRIDVGVLVARSPGTESEEIRSFAERMASDAVDELGDGTDVAWRFFAEKPVRLRDGDARRPSEFLDRATHLMVAGPYDLVLVVTDAPLLSSRERFVPGLASPIARVAVVSTGTLLRGNRDELRRRLDSEPVRRNAAALLLHLIGHLLGARHRDGGVMEPFQFEIDRATVPRFDTDVERYLRRIAANVPQEETTSRSSLRRLGFHAASVVRNGRLIVRALANSRAPLLPLSLPKLTTAAVAPTLVIVFSAEAWDVGFHMSDATAALFAATSVVAAALYLLFAQNLSFPRERRHLVTEHTALVNVTVFLVLLFAMVGLFAFVWAIMLLVEFVVFPPNLMSNWPSLEDPTVGVVDLVRTGAFISTIGVLSGALAGGLESRTIVRHLTLFLPRP